MTHYELAKRADVASQGVMRFVKGERGLTLDVADRLCEALGLVLCSDRTRPARRLKAKLEEAKRRLSEARKLQAHAEESRRSAEKRLRETEQRMEEAEREATSPETWWGRRDGRYRLESLLVEADNSGNRPMLRLGLKYLHGRARWRERESLHRFLATMKRDNPLWKEVIAMSGLAAFLEGLMAHCESQAFFETLGGKVTPAEIEHVVQSADTSGAL